MQKVWNITDGPRYRGAARTIMLFGKTVPPGRYVLVPEARLARAHKLVKDIDAGMVHVGDLPGWYLASKKPPRVPFPIGHSRAHGPALEKSPTLDKEVSAKVDAAVDKVTTPVVEKAKDPEKLEESKKDSTDDTDKDQSGGKGKKSRG